MIDPAITDAIAALAKGQLLTVEELRETRSLTRMMVERLGLICDQNAAILRQVEQSNSRHNDSERNIRAVRSIVEDVVKRFEPVEAAYKAEASKRASPG